MKKKLFGSHVRDDFGDVFSDLSEGELLDHGTSSGKFLDEFAEKEVHSLLVECGVFATIERKRGLADIRLSLDLSDVYVHKLYLRSPKTDEPLCELFLRVTKSTDNFRALDDTPSSAVAAGANFVKSWAKTRGPLRMLVIEWMLLQDPFKSAAGVKLLPGQKMIGLGCAQEVVAFIRRLADGLGVHGLMNKPLYFHNAFLYAPLYTFLNPEIEASFRLLVSDLDGDIRERGLGAVSHAINYGALRHRSSGAVVAWTHEEQVRPLGTKLEHLFRSPAFLSLLQSRMGEQGGAQSGAVTPVDAKSEPTPKNETATGTESESRAEPESGTEPESRAESRAEWDFRAKPELKKKSEAEAETALREETEGGGEPESRAEAGTEMETERRTETQTESEAETERNLKTAQHSETPCASETATATERPSRGMGDAQAGSPPESGHAKRAELQRAESMAYENAATGSEAELRAPQATPEQPREASMSLFKTVLDDFKARKRAPSSREPIFEIDWELPVEDRASVEERLKHAIPFKEFGGVL